MIGSISGAGEEALMPGARSVAKISFDKFKPDGVLASYDSMVNEQWIMDRVLVSVLGQEVVFRNGTTLIDEPKSQRVTVARHEPGKLAPVQRLDRTTLHIEHSGMDLRLPPVDKKAFGYLGGNDIVLARADTGEGQSISEEGGMVLAVSRKGAPSRGLAGAWSRVRRISPDTITYFLYVAPDGRCNDLVMRVTSPSKGGEPRMSFERAKSTPASDGETIRVILPEIGEEFTATPILSRRFFIRGENQT